MAIGDVVGEEISALMGELKGLAVDFIDADTGKRTAFYRKSARQVVSEANARAIIAAYTDNAKRARFQGTYKGKELKLRPKAPQRKKDGFRGAQMNFWLYVDGQYFKDFNIHVDVVTLEKELYAKFKDEKDKDGFGLTKADAERRAKQKAAELRETNNWEEFAAK